MSTVVSSAELLLRSIVFTRPVRLVDPPSWVPHIPFAFWLIDALRPRTVVELGTQSGVSYSAFAQAVQMLGLDAATYAVDTWKGDHQAGFYGEDVFKEWSSFHDQHFSAFSRLVRSTFEEALSKFPDGSVDLLHIDGAHNYEAVRQDFESWVPKLSNRAVVLMHDTNVREADFEVWRFWPEVASRYPCFAFLHGHGLGVVGVGHSLPSDVQWLVRHVNSHAQTAASVREFFATLGEALLRQFSASREAQERAHLVGRLAERDALVADLARQVSSASVALDRARVDALAQDEQMSTMTRELASLREELRASREQAASERTRAQMFQGDLAVIREHTRTAERKADEERSRAQGLQNEIAALRRRLDRTNERHATSNRELLKLRATASRLTRLRAAQTARERKLARALKQVYRSRSWRWTAPVRRVFRAAGGSGVSAFAVRRLRGWARVARTLLSPSRLREVREVARCGLFDKAFYLRTYPDVGHAAIPPLMHYVVTGAREGRRPHPLFDGKYYLARNADVRKSGANPLVHFVRKGATALRDPHPLFSVRYYLATNPDIPAGLNPLSHYLRFGGQNGLTPHSLFDPVFYLNQADVGAPGVNPLVHFVEHGARAGGSPHPLFDAKFYLKERGDGLGVKVNPLLHYLEAGLGESHDPHPLFQNTFYLGQVAELPRLDITPLQHFVESGVKEGRRPNPFFDPVWYLQTYSDVAKSGQNPLVYYATQGWKEGHDPSPRFSTTYYLKANADVEASGACPLAHYLRHGRREGRLPRKGAAPDSSAVPDVPPRVRLKVHRVDEISERFSQETIAATAAAPPAATIIYVSHVIPFPPRAGNEYRIHRMLVHLRQSGYRIVLLIAPLAPQTIEDAQWEELAAAYGNVVHCERDGHVRYRLDECPDVLAQLDGLHTRDYAALLGEVHAMSPTARELLNVDRTYCHDALVATLEHLQSSVRPCAVIAGYIWMTRGLPLLDSGLLTLIDTIDVFSTYREKVGAFGVSGWDVPSDEESRRLSRAMAIVAIQPEEARILRTLAPNREVLTAGVDFEVIDSDWPADPMAFCVGSDNPRNMLGLRDFLKFAWPEIRSAVPNARLTVAGSVGAAVPDYVKGVDVLGHVDDLDPLYLKARVVVNPAVAGTGLKVKTVEALSRLRPIVTWPNGLEGLPPGMAELVPPAQDWFDFAECVTRWLRAETPAFDAATSASFRQVLSADLVYGALKARLARFFDANRSPKT